MNIAPNLPQPLHISFAGNALQIQTNCQAAAEVAEFVFRWHVNFRTPTDTVTLLEVLADTDSDGYQLHVNGELVSVANCLADLPVVLMQLAQRHLIVAEAGKAMLHAALLSKNGRGVLLPAVAGSGKTTLAAWLLGQGFDFCSDELAAVDSTGISDGLTRPLNIKPGSMKVVSSFDWLHEAQQLARLSCGVMLVPWGHAPLQSLPLQLIVSPKFVPGASLHVEPLSPGRCVMMLMETLLNARNLPKHGLTLTTRLAATLPSYRITYSRLEDVSQWLAGTHEL
ncbi:MAG: hypothetical protein IPN53_11105 [Comamonadaceae bacterium]|nr:hypothetical protein [Comamonadaceae bacterium]